MGDAELPPAPVTFTPEQLDSLAKLLVASLTRGNIVWLATSVLGMDAEKLAGNETGDPEAFARRIVQEMNDVGKIPEAIGRLREQTHTNARLTVTLKSFLRGDDLMTDAQLQGLINEYEPFVSSQKFAEYFPKVMRTVCAVALGNPSNEIVGSGFLIAPDLVMTNFHVLETFLDIDEATNKVKANGPGNQIFFFFDYLSAPAPDMPPTASPLVTAADDWLVYARASLQGDGTATCKPIKHNEYDYAIVRLARRVGALSVRKGGGGRRGWLELPKEKIETLGERRILVFQHPEAAPQQWDIGDFVQLDQTETRVRYSVSTAHGSSGGAALDSTGQLFALHNAEVKTAPTAAGKKLNQGVRIDKIVEDLKAMAPAVLEIGPEAADSRLFWSLSDDPKNLSPIIGRTGFRDTIVEMLSSNVERVLVVTGPPASGRRYSIELLRHTLGMRVPIVEFSATDLQTREPKQFLEDLIKGLGLEVLGQSIPDVLPTENVSRWLRLDVPSWLRDRLAEDEQENRFKYPAWIVVNTIMPKGEPFPWRGDLKDCMAALVGAHDPGQPNIPIPQLRWLFLCSPGETLPTGGVKQREEDLAKDNKYDDDFAACFQLAYSSVDKEASLKDFVLKNLANLQMRSNQALPESDRQPSRKMLAGVVRDLINEDPLAKD